MLDGFQVVNVLWHASQGALAGMCIEDFPTALAYAPVWQSPQAIEATGA